jgi:hypothetical protein
MSAEDGPPPSIPPLFPRWFSFGLLPFLAALAITVAVAAYLNHQSVASGAPAPGTGAIRTVGSR